MGWIGPEARGGSTLGTQINEPQRQVDDRIPPPSTSGSAFPLDPLANEVLPRALGDRRARAMADSGELQQYGTGEAS